MRTALVIEDDATCSDLLEMVLTAIPNLTVDTVRTGHQARRQQAAHEPYSLVITDFHLPGEDGLNVVRDLRAMPGCARMPFVVVTSSRDAEIRTRAAELGALAVFEKPFSPARLREDINSILNGL